MRAFPVVCPSDASQTRTVPSTDAETTRWPSGLNATLIARRGSLKVSSSCPVATSHDLLPVSWSVRDVRFLDTLHFEEDQPLGGRCAFTVRSRNTARFWRTWTRSGLVG